MRRARGFTLLELMVSGAIGLLVATLALGWVLTLDAVHRRRTATAHMRQLSATVFDALIAELRQAGLGTPPGRRAEGPKEQFPTRIVRAGASEIAFVVDLPRPDADVNGLAALDDDQTTGAPPQGLAVRDELNGGCDIGLGGAASCDTAASSLVLSADAGRGCHLDPNAPTCPWGLQKYRPREWVIVVDGSGRWVERQLGATLAADSPTRRMLALDAALPPAMVGSARNGWVATPDRVFYRLDGGTLERDQCWGPVGSPATAGALALPCSPSAGTGWEQLASLPPGSTLTFTYYDTRGQTLAPPLSAALLARVQRIDAALHLEQKVGESTVEWDTASVVALRR